MRLTDDRAVLPTWFVVDGTASMAFPDLNLSPIGARGDRVTKWQLACAMTVGLASVAHASSDPVGLIVVGTDGPVRQAARTRRGTVGELARALDQLRVGGDRPLAPLLQSIPVMARVVIVSDLLGDHDALLRAAAQRTVAGGHVECIHVVAAEEVRLPEGAYLARDAEAAASDRAAERALDRGAYKGYSTAFAAFRRDAAQRWRASGAGYTEVRTDALVSRTIRQIAAGTGRAAPSSHGHA